MPHSSSTRSRRRARPASSRSAVGRGRGQHQVVPADGRLDATGQPFEAGSVLGPGAGPQVLDGHVLAGQPGLRVGPPPPPGPPARRTAGTASSRPPRPDRRGVGAEAGLPVSPAVRRTSRSRCPRPGVPSGSTPAPRRPGRAAGPVPAARRRPAPSRAPGRAAPRPGRRRRPRRTGGPHARPSSPPRRARRRDLRWSRSIDHGAEAGGSSRAAAATDGPDAPGRSRR